MENPKKWRVYDGRDPDAELESLQMRFGAISIRYGRYLRIRRLVRAARVPALTAIAVFVVMLIAFRVSPFTPMDTLRHIAAAPNCDAARAVGLAPARRGQPGYWPSHDADNDGIACEPWPR